MPPSFATLSLLAALLSACTVKLGDDPEGSSSSTTADTDATAGNSSAPTGDGPDATTGVIPETTTGVEEDSTTADTDSTGGEPSACALMCEHAAQCGLSDDPATCTTLCEGDLAESAPACAAASTTAMLCFTGLSCEHLADALSGGPAHACDPAQNERKAACGADESCDFGAGGNFEATKCELEIFCDGEPVQKMTCDAEQCLCLEDGEQVASCPADAICGTLDEISAKGVSCCGFPLVGP